MTKIVWAVVFSLTQIQTLTAQTPGFDDDVQDVPVNQWVFPMVIMGIALICVIIKKEEFKKSKLNQNEE